MRGYTLRQLRAYAEAADRAVRRERVLRTLDMRAAQLADGDKVESYLKALMNG